MKYTVNKDLKNEREKCTFNVEEFTNFLDGGVKNTLNRRKLGLYLFDSCNNCIGTLFDILLNKGIKIFFF